MFRNRISHLLRAEYKGILYYVYLNCTKLKQVKQYIKKTNHEVFVTTIFRNLQMRYLTIKTHDILETHYP
jgi:hypothetical protein